METSDEEHVASAPRADATDIGLWGSLHGLELLVGIGRETTANVRFVGSSDPAVAKRLGECFDLDPADDLRNGLPSSDDFTLVVADPEFDPSSLQGSRSLINLEPPSLVSSDGMMPAMLGSFTLAPGFRSLEEVLQDFGPISSVHFTGHCTEGQGTLHSRLHDAFCVINALLGTPEMIDGMLVGPTDIQSNQPGRHHADNVSDDLAGITGYLGALVRCLPRATATISVSDQLDWQRCLRIMGPSGILDVMENTISWRKSDGILVDDGETLANPFAFHCSNLSSQIRDSVNGSRPTMQQEELDSVMACCEAARLSCRTRAPESPDKVRDLLSRT